MQNIDGIAAGKAMDEKPVIDVANRQRRIAVIVGRTPGEPPVSTRLANAIERAQKRVNHLRADGFKRAAGD